ncbi:hypothetical protein GCM10009716_34800 [Streptomyces sodiiphilus]|uniref:Transmembrane protein n=1 Tax=Streptomyces sodiiphilus TaxID=226217 RepID=A0ABN2PML7_9ACTN
MEAGPRESEARAGRPFGENPEEDLRAPAPEPLADAPAADPGTAAERGENYGELRPPRRLRLVQLAPIVLLSLLGSLMFAFPLAFAFDDAGAVVAMLGLLIGCSAAGWGMMAARRVGYSWPGLPPRGSGRRPDWRVLALYGVGLTLLAAFAVWRVAGLR